MATGGPQEVTVGSTGAVGRHSGIQPACMTYLSPIPICRATEAFRPSLLMPGFKIPDSKIHVQNVILAGFLSLGMLNRVLK